MLRCFVPLNYFIDSQFGAVEFRYFNPFRCCYKQTFSSVNIISLFVFNCFSRNVSIIIIMPLVLQVKFRVLN